MFYCRPPRSGVQQSTLTDSAWVRNESQVWGLSTVRQQQQQPPFDVTISPGHGVLCPARPGPTRPQVSCSAHAFGRAQRPHLNLHSARLPHVRSPPHQTWPSVRRTRPIISFYDRFDQPSMQTPDESIDCCSTNFTRCQVLLGSSFHPSIELLPHVIALVITWRTQWELGEMSLVILSFCRRRTPLTKRPPTNRHPIC